MFARRFGPNGIVGRDHQIAVGAERRGEKHSVILREHRYFFGFLPVAFFLATGFTLGFAAGFGTALSLALGLDAGCGVAVGDWVFYGFGTAATRSDKISDR